MGQDDVGQDDVGQDDVGQDDVWQDDEGRRSCLLNVSAEPSIHNGAG